MDRPPRCERGVCRSVLVVDVGRGPMPIVCGRCWAAGLLYLPAVLLVFGWPRTIMPFLGGGGVARMSSRGIFLSYRREDAAPYARLLQLQLRERIPDVRVFMDLDSIEPGLDFAKVIRGAIDSCA